MVAEGHAREATRRIQQFRKDSGLEISDRINLDYIVKIQSWSRLLQIIPKRYPKMYWLMTYWFIKEMVEQQSKMSTDWHLESQLLLCSKDFYKAHVEICT